MAGRGDVVDRADRGRLGSASGPPLLLLSRLTPTSPLHDASDAFDPDVVQVPASGPGADRDTSWVRSVLSRPDDVVVEIGCTTARATGRLLLEHERDALLERYRDVAQDQRVTPVSALTLEQAS
jgi:hypothetical protein